ncbi:cytochrome P450 [Streptomyces xanthochromogenes]|uniref:cytochrome P450 n=1 Tax=Streptomyces xanthochromogenes TaxID=67384 RepID=UPI0034132DC1
MTAVEPLIGIPGPAGDTYLGNLHAFSSDPLGFLTSCAREYGDVVRLGDHNVLLTGPELVERMLVDRGGDFNKKGVEDSGRAARGRGFPTAMMNSDGAEWKLKRRRMQPAFGRTLAVKAAELVDAQGERMLASWKLGEQRDLHGDVSVLVLRLVTQLMFGDEFTDRDAALVSRLVRPIMELSTSPLLLPDWVPTPRHIRLKRGLRDMDRLLRRLTSDPAAVDAERAPVLHALVTGTPAPSPQELRDELATLVLSAFETSNDAVVWTSVLLARHPDIAERVRDEARAAFSAAPPGLSRMERLPYTGAVVRESLRLYSPAWMTSRDSTADLRFGGFTVPAGTTVTVSQWVNHRDPRYWDRAEEFDPGRWLDDSARKMPRGSYFPFGLGARACIGASLATTEIVHIVADVWRRHRLELVDPRGITPRPALALQPMGVKVVPRAW